MSSSNKITSNPSQVVPPTGIQVFKYVSLWETLLLKTIQGRMMKSGWTYLQYEMQGLTEPS